MAGFTRVAGACVACGAGTFKQGYRRSLDFPAVACIACTNCTRQGQYEVQACRNATDAVCRACSGGCPRGQYITGACGGVRDLQCTPCAGQCPVDHWRRSSSTCSGVTWYDQMLQEICWPCINASLCPAGQIIKQRCTGLGVFPPQCEACTPVAGGCPRDTYMGGCKGFQDYACFNFTRCGPGRYLDKSSRLADGVCTACTDCAGLGLATLVPCETYSDTVCVGAPCGAGLGSCSGRYFCLFASGGGNTTGQCYPCPVRLPLCVLCLVFDLGCVLAGWVRE